MPLAVAITDTTTIATIRGLASKGRSHAELARRFGCSTHIIGRIVKRKGPYGDVKPRPKPKGQPLEIAPYDLRQGLQDCPGCRKRVYLPNQKYYPGRPCVACQVRKWVKEKI